MEVSISISVFGLVKFSFEKGPKFQFSISLNKKPFKGFECFSHFGLVKFRGFLSMKIQF